MIDALAKVLVASGLEPGVFTAFGADEAFFRGALVAGKIGRRLEELGRAMAMKRAVESSLQSNPWRRAPWAFRERAITTT